MLFISHLQSKDTILMLPVMAFACWIGFFDIVNVLDNKIEEMVFVMRINLGQTILETIPLSIIIKGLNN